MTSTEARPADDPGPLRRRLALTAVLFLTALCFAPGLNGAFVYDDLLLVERNPLVRDPSRFVELLSSGLWDFLDPETARQIGYWRPLTGLALALGYRLGDGAPFALHALSLLLHLAATAAAWRLACRITKSTSLATATALLFGLHPVHVEAVSWISAINDPLYSLFVLLAADAWLAWRERGSAGIAWRAGALALLAMLSKEQGVAAIPLVLALDLALRRDPEHGRVGRATLEPIARGYGALLAAVLAYYLARAAVFDDLLAGFDRTVTDFGVPAARLFLLRLEILGGALALLAWPFDLQLFRPFVPAASLANAPVAIAIAAIALWSAGVAWAWRRRASLALVALLSTVAVILPLVLRIRSLGLFPLSERFLYLAAFGACFGAASLAFRFLPRRAASLAVALVALAWGVRSTTRTSFWKDEETIFRSEVAASPRSPYVRWGLGRVLLEKYRRTQDPEVLREANAAIVDAIDLLDAAQQGDATIFATRDDHLQSHLGLGWSLLYEAEIDEYHDFATALAVFERIVASRPENELALTGAGVALTFLGRLDEAQAVLERALAANPRYVEARHALGILAMRRGDWAFAARAFEAALEERPDHLDDQLWLAKARSQTGDVAGAKEILERARAGHPDSSAPLVLQATLAAQANDAARAAELVERALALDRDDGEAWLLKGRLHRVRGEDAAAETALVRATELLPLSFEAHYSLAELYLARGRRDEALPYLVRAYAQRPQNEIGATLQKLLEGLAIEDVDRLGELAGADAARGLDDGALYWIGRILALRPDHGETHFARARIEDRRGDKEAALASFRRAAELMPSNRTAHLALGEQLIELRRGAEAIAPLERALAIFVAAEGANPDAQAAIGELRRKVEELRRQVAELKGE